MSTAAFPDTYRHLFGPVCASCRRLLGSSALAEDVTQEAFLRLWRAGPPLAETEAAAVMRWLQRTSVRLSIDVLRRSKRIDAGARPETMPSLSPDPTNAAAARAAITSMIERVPEVALEAAILSRVDGLCQPEVARVLGVSERTVRRLLARFDERTADLRAEHVQRPAVAPAPGRTRRVRGAALGFVLFAAALLFGRSCDAAETNAELRSAPSEASR